MRDKIRIAVIGARRGKSFIRAAHGAESGLELVAVCDTNPAALTEWKDVAGVRLFSNYEDVLNEKNIDAVCLATPVRLHARQAIAGLNAGKHILSEVTAAYEMAECWDLVAAAERSDRTYMMAENYCFTEAVLQVQHMVELGVFGDLVYASGSYIHDCRNLLFDDAGDLTWRGERGGAFCGNGYPTHSLGPVARWLGINRTDWLEQTATWPSRSQAVAHFARRNLPHRPEHARTENWIYPDTTTTHIRTEEGRLIELRVDSISPRPHHMNRYELQGTQASFSWPDGLEREPLVWIEGRSPSSENGVAERWEPLFKYRDEFAHPLWREHRERASQTGHHGGDFFVLREFAAAIREGRAPLIDVYDAVTWSCITPLSAASIAAGNAPVAVPNFRSSRS